jgi:hypothetical protein
MGGQNFGIASGRDQRASDSLACPIEVTKEIAMSNPAPAALDLDRFLLDPGSSFRRPEDVVGDPRLRRQQKIEILCRWAYDAAELAVAEEEGMSAAAKPATSTGFSMRLSRSPAGSTPSIPGQPNILVFAFSRPQTHKGDSRNADGILCGECDRGVFSEDIENRPIAADSR